MKQTDVLGNTPEIGDKIVFNPAKYKGLVFGSCVGFMKSSGLPIVELDEQFKDMHFGQSTNEGNYTPKTGFVIAYHKTKSNVHTESDL